MKISDHAALLGSIAASCLAVACGTSGDSVPASPDPTPTAIGTPPGSTTPSTPPGSTPNDPSTPSKPAEPTGPTGTPISAPASTWSWVDVPEAVCDDGTPTGIGIWPSPSPSKKLMLFFAGGGACWDYDTCVKNTSSVHGPFGKAEFDKMSPAFGGWIIGHGDTNPFKDWTTVFVPYCTSDIHAGDAVTTYTDGKTSKDFHHKGRANVAAYLARLEATFPSLEQLAVTGSSAGGGGAIFNYPAVRDKWPATQGILVDDSLPFFKDAIPLGIRQAWFSSWNLTPLTTPICGANCIDDMSGVFSGMATRYPNDRLALLSFTTDYVIGGYYKMNLFQYWSVLAGFTKSALDPTQHFKRFYADTWGHTMLTDMDKHKQNGVKLTDWLAKLASNDPTWASVGP